MKCPNRTYLNLISGSFLFSMALLTVFPFTTAAVNRTKSAATGEFYNSQAKQPLPKGTVATTADSDLVEVRFNVIDRSGRFVSGLSEDAFAVFQDGERKEIKYYSDEKSPATIFIMIALSDSTNDETFKSVRRALARFLEGRNTFHDEFIIIRYESRNDAIASDIFKTESEISYYKPIVVETKPGIGLLEACSLAFPSITKPGRTSSPILLLVTDTLDNKMLGVSSNLNRQLRESDVMFFTLGIVGKNKLVTSSKNDNHPVVILSELSSLSGGQATFSSRKIDIEDFFYSLTLRLEYMYTIRFKPSAIVNEGSLCKANVQIHPPKGLDGLIVRNKQGLVWGKREQSIGR